MRTHLGHGAPGCEVSTARAPRQIGEVAVRVLQRDRLRARFQSQLYLLISTETSEDEDARA